MRIGVTARGLLVACLATVPGLTAAAQESETPALQAELKKLGAAALSLQRDLPSFECTETALSQSLKKDKVKQEVRFVADLRVERVEGGRLNERLQVSAVNGKPYSGGTFEPPFMVKGGFGESLFFFLPAMRTCFKYTLSDGRIDFVSPPGTFNRPECRNTGAPSGMALLDDAGNALHLERQVRPELAPEVHVVDSTAINFASVELDGKVYPLPSRMMADIPKKDGMSLHFEAAYTGCHLFKAKSTILPDVTPVPEGESAKPHP
jgi:hypothetical protein